MVTNVSTPAAHPIESRSLAYAWLFLFASLVFFELWQAPTSPTFWVNWEIGTLVTAIVFSIVFYARLFYRGLYEGLARHQVGNVVLSLLFALVCMVCAALITSGSWKPNIDGFMKSHFASSVVAFFNPSVVTLTFLAFGMLGFCTIDHIFATNHKDQAVKDEFARGFWFNGLPVLFSFLVLLLFAGRFPISVGNHEHLKSFVGGAVAFEVLTGNTVFVVLFWKPRGL